MVIGPVALDGLDVTLRTVRGEWKSEKNNVQFRMDQMHNKPYIESTCTSILAYRYP